MEIHLCPARSWKADNELNLVITVVDNRICQNTKIFKYKILRVEDGDFSNEPGLWEGVYTSVWRENVSRLGICISEKKKNHVQKLVKR